MSIVDDLKNKLTNGCKKEGKEGTDEGIVKIEKTEGTEKPQTVKQGHVYFLQGRIGSPVKIGYTTDILSRHKQIQPCCPDKIFMIWTIEADRQLEAYLHKLFSVDRLHGEWFQFSIKIVEYIRSKIAEEIQTRVDRLRELVGSDNDKERVGDEILTHLKEIENATKRLNCWRLHWRNANNWIDLKDSDVFHGKECDPSLAVFRGKPVVDADDEDENWDDDDDDDDNAYLDEDD